MNVVAPEAPEATQDTHLAGAERRKGNQLLRHWEQLGQGRTLPALADIDPKALTMLWRYCFVAVRGRYGLLFTYVGPAVLRGWGVASGSGLEGIPPAVIAMIEEPAHEAEVNGAPAMREGQVANGWGDELLYRAVALPLSDDGVAVSHVLGLLDYVELRRDVVKGVSISTSCHPRS